MSFKLRLVAYFLLVSLLPLGAAGWALHEVLRSSETRRVDVRLDANLRAVSATYKAELRAATRRARSLADSTSLQRALLRDNRAELTRLVTAQRGVRVETPRFAIGPVMIARGPGVKVTNSGRVVGTVVAGIPLTEAGLAQLSESAGLASDEKLVVLHDG